MLAPPETVDAGEVVLRKWRPEWAEQTAAAVRASLTELMPFMPWATAEYDTAAAGEYIARATAQWKESESFSYAAFDAAGALVGSASLMSRMGHGILEIGYWIHSAHTGRGYATGAAVALARAGLALPGIERIVIRHDAANLASGRVAAKAGFTEVDRVEHPRDTHGSSGTDVVWDLRA